MPGQSAFVERVFRRLQIEDPQKSATAPDAYILELINFRPRRGRRGAMDMRRLVGRNFTRLRKEKGLTQEDVEASTGFSQQYVSGLERGRRNPTVISLFLLSQVLGVSPMELVRPDEQALSEVKTD